MNYAYKSPAGEVIWKQWTLAEFDSRGRPQELEVGGVEYRRSFQSERAGLPATKGWPLACVASGVNAGQAQELRDHFKEVGVPTEVTSGGDPIYRDAAHRKRALKARGFFDRSAYY